MIIVRLSGGLGNQMFQYAFGLAQAERHAADFKIDASRYGTLREPRPFSLDAFNISAPKAGGSDIFWNKLFKKVREPGPAFSPDILARKNGYFWGNWQTERYFTEYADLVRQEFTLKNWSAKAQALKLDIEAQPASVSLHVRRGDYATNPHLTQKHGLLSPEYYVEALRQMSAKAPGVRVYVFSDDIEWARSNLVLPASAVFVSGQGLSIPEELALMSICRNHIVANSTYSWWGAWLDPRSDKTVIAPATWYAGGIDSNDLVPEGWIRV